jgi:glycosyltransferase involved in cell wall biosynthesis
MISILIPVHNHFVENLVNELHRQATDIGRDFEIIISDDASLDEYRSINARLQSLKHVKYFQHDKDLKRSGNRNFLGQQAKYDYLLFIDGDALVSSNDFIEKYLGHCSERVIACGGTGYPKAPPDNTDYFLRWFYGWRREARSAATRNKNPGKSFSAFNFLIKRSLFLENKFPVEVTEYGHEDTLFGLHLAIKGYHIIHIDNSLIHNGIETNREFMDKSLTAVENLYRLLSHEKYGSYITVIRIVKWYRFCKKTGISLLLNRLYPWLKKPVEQNLMSRKPDLFLFDLYKLGHMLQLHRINSIRSV